MELDLDLLEVPPLEEENLPLFLVLDQSVSSEQVEEPPQTKLELDLSQELKCQETVQEPLSLQPTDKVRDRLAEVPEDQLYCLLEELGLDLEPNPQLQEAVSLSATPLLPLEPELEQELPEVED